MADEARPSRPWLTIGLGGVTSLLLLPFCLVAAGLSWLAYTTYTGTLATILTLAAVIFFLLLPVVPVLISIIATRLSDSD